MGSKKSLQTETVESDGHWYFVANNGMATLCIDREDAVEGAVEADMAYPRMAPHRAVRLVPADHLPDAGKMVASEVDIVLLGSDYPIAFVCEGKTVGGIFIKDGKLAFEGDAEPSARAFFEILTPYLITHMREHALISNEATNWILECIRAGYEKGREA